LTCVSVIPDLIGNPETGKSILDSRFRGNDKKKVSATVLKLTHMKQSSGQNPLSSMGVFGSVGFTMVAATFAGFAAGLWLDSRFDTSPWFMVLLLLAGFMAALLNVYFRARQNRK